MASLSTVGANSLKTIPFKTHEEQPGQERLVGRGSIPEKTTPTKIALGIGTRDVLNIDSLLGLQRTAGNAAVTRLLDTYSQQEVRSRSRTAVPDSDTTETFALGVSSAIDCTEISGSPQPIGEKRYMQQTISALIRRRPAPEGNSNRRQRRDTSWAGGLLRDAGPDDDTPDPGLQAAQIAYEPPSLDLPEPAEGESVTVPDIVPTGTIEFVDSVASTLTYQPVISNTGAPPSGFGITRPDLPGLFGVLITKTEGSYVVSATAIQGINWQVRGPTGPGGQVDIESLTDPDITSSNFPQVVSDLTPNSAAMMSSPRTQFWARDLSVDHEMFHANEMASHGRDGANLAQNFLNHSAASSLADVWSLLNQVPQKIMNTIMAAMPHDDAERRAYRAGAPDYQRRADAIQIIGNASGYP